MQSVFARFLVLLLLLPGVSIAQQLKKPAGLRIPVDDVEPATAPYNVFDNSPVLEQSMMKKILVASAEPQQLIPINGNSFLETVHLAYAQHHDLVLSPDDIWIQIALGVSIHLNKNYEKLQAKVVRSPEKVTYAIRMDDLVSMSEKSWQRLVDTFALLARKKVQPDFYSTMLPEFSTSTPETRTVLNAILLSSVKESMELRSSSGCGIPNVILLGEKYDWERLLEHVDQLEKYDLKFWTDELKPVLQEFINCYDGKVDQAFWQRIYKYREGYMMMQMNGWISKFFPYFKDGEWIDDPVELEAYANDNPGMPVDEGVVRTKFYLNPYLHGDDYLYHAIDLWLLPSSVCSVPLVWENLFSKKPEDHEQQLFLHAGFAGTVQDEKTLALRNNPSWFIVKQQDYLEVDYDNYLSSGKKTASFATCIWSDKIVSGSNVTAIYHPETNATASEGWEELTAELSNQLKKEFPGEELKGTHLSFLLSHFGNCTNVKITESQLSERAQVALELKMHKLAHRFQPSVIPFDKAERIELMDERPPATIPVNSEIVLTF